MVGVTRNPLFTGVMAVTFVLQYVLVQFTGMFFKVRPLTPVQWGYCIAFGVGSLPMQFIVNLALVTFSPPTDQVGPKRTVSNAHDNEGTEMIQKA